MLRVSHFEPGFFWGDLSTTIKTVLHLILRPYFSLAFFFFSFNRLSNVPIMTYTPSMAGAGWR
jgi:hypothetical protein